MTTIKSDENSYIVIENICGFHPMQKDGSLVIGAITADGSTHLFTGAAAQEFIRHTDVNLTDISSLPKVPE